MGCLTNGYTTEAATRMMMEIFSFVHIGLKGFSNTFYREFVGIPDMEPILRNIRMFAQTCHVEIASPVIEDVNDHELFDIAQFIHDIRPDIPWHVFRLLPEHHMKESLYPNIGSAWAVPGTGSMNSWPRTTPVRNAAPLSPSWEPGWHGMKNNPYNGRPCHEPGSNRCKGMAEPV